MTYVKELEMLAKKNNGLLSPHVVVEYAKNPETLLHEKFEWDDSVAAYNWRVHQARMMIAALVVNNSDIKINEKVFVSVAGDRKRDASGGYRFTRDVLSDSDRRDIFFDQCIRAIEGLIERFRHFKELAVILEEAKDKVTLAKSPSQIYVPDVCLTSPLDSGKNP